MHNFGINLPQWLDFLEQRQSVAVITMGLERVLQLKEELGLVFTCPVIMVGGTNGKGSTCAMLEAILLQAGYRVGLYSKPHFLDFNERCRINGESVSDAALVASFEAVEAARGQIALSHFEFTTLAILYLLTQQGLDCAILEVGMGGMTDAVNVIDSDVAIVTSIDIDHVQFLGETREAIALHKAGIFRLGKVAICSDPQPPASLIDYAAKIGADLWLFGRDFNYSADKQQWNYGGRSQRRHSLAYPGLRGANQLLNACAALAALEALRLRLPVGAQEVRTGLAMVELPGRFQVLPGRPNVILDVAHNPHATATLAHNLGKMGFYRYTYAVIGAMQDKALAQMIQPLIPYIDHWLLTPLPSLRSASTENLAVALTAASAANTKKNGQEESSVTSFTDVKLAYAAATERATQDDRIVVFGSFLTVAAVLAARKSMNV